MLLRVLYFFFLLTTCSLRAQDQHSFTSAPFSFRIGAPLTWKLLPASFPTEDYELQNKNLFDLVEKERSVPIIRIVKPVPGNHTISPAVQVFVQSAEGQTPTDFLSSTCPSAAAGFEDFQILQKASDTTLNGIRAASMESTFITVYPGGRRFRTLSRLWAIPRDNMMFVISISGQPDDLKALTNEVDMILRTIRFTKE
jgi:hypothetical protein